MTIQPNLFSLPPAPSFVEGIARALDLGGTLRNQTNRYASREVDSAAVLSDWMVTGDDLRGAITVYGERI
ncbi:MAG: hypothetical protein JSS49_16430 [Planctomycetes bacterium]|nr:hypothetical protein [Planctomycetota bacterium]